MANLDRPNGFTFAKTLSGAPVVAMMRHYEVDTDNSGTVAIGDAVTLEADGRVTRAATGATVLGVVSAVGNTEGTGITHDQGFPGYFNPDDLAARHLPTSTSGVVAVIPAEDNLFFVQSDSNGGTVVVGALADITDAAANTLTGFSQQELDVTPVNNDLKIVELASDPEFDATTANANVIVTFMTKNHE